MSRRIAWSRHDAKPRHRILLLFLSDFADAWLRNRKYSASHNVQPRFPVLQITSSPLTVSSSQTRWPSSNDLFTTSGGYSLVSESGPAVQLHRSYLTPDHLCLLAPLIICPSNNTSLSASYLIQLNHSHISSPFYYLCGFTLQEHNWRGLIPSLSYLLVHRATFLLSFRINIISTSGMDITPKSHSNTN